MKVIAEIGSCWLPGTHPIEDAIQAALDCGADLVKLQFWSYAYPVRKRRGGQCDLSKWVMNHDALLDLVAMFPKKIGVSVFWPDDVEDFFDTADGLWQTLKDCLAFLKTATQEYQYAHLAEAVSLISDKGDIPLYVSVPSDGCLTMGNYSSPLPITWMYCEPYYPAKPEQYRATRLLDMSERLPGKIGLSDHTPGSELVRMWRDSVHIVFAPEDIGGVCREGLVKLDCIEKHFCYDESLRGKVPDGGPWSLSREAFTEYAKIAHGK